MEASDLGPPQEPPEEPGKNKAAETKNGGTWLDLERIAKAVGPVILTAGGFVGFLAFAGSVIVWTRFQAAQVPPDQAVAVYPRGELVAVASALLLVFGFVGLLAVLILLLVNPKGQASIGVSRALLGLLAVEGVAAIAFVDGAWNADKALALEMFMFPLFVALWATFLFERKDLGEEPGAGRTTEWMGDTIQGILPGSLRPSAFVNRTLFAVVLTLIVSLVLTKWLPAEWVAIVALAVICVGPTAWLTVKLAVNEPTETRILRKGEIPFERAGQMLIGGLLIAGAFAPSLLLQSKWLPFSLFAAVGLIAAVWRVAVMTDGFIWVGLAVFVSIQLFGTITAVVRNVDDPQVQPLALIRQEDGPDEAIQGIYVTETDDRVYFATVATEGCTPELVPNSGRLLWVPKEDVVAMSIGPPQSVDDATKTTLEMSYAPTPAVETPAGDRVSLTVAEKRNKAKEPTESSQKRRLEDVGPAVRPNFGRGLTLTPENASPGDVVVLKMAAPRTVGGERGFGPSRAGKTVRLGGVPVAILKETVQRPDEAEYIQTVDERPLALDKGKLYVWRNGTYAEENDPDFAKEAVFIHLNEESVVEMNEHGPRGDNYLPIEMTEDGRPALAATEERPKVAFEDGSEIPVETRLLRQDWHESHVRFRVPEHAATGMITVECEQLAGQPLLRVARPPRASITVRFLPGSRRVIFDSSRSADSSGIASRQWLVEGVDRGKGNHISVNMPPRTQSYSVGLRVTDAEGEQATAELRLLRLPEHYVSYRKRRSRHPKILDAARTELKRAIAAAPSASIEFEMRPGELPAPPNPEETIDSARRIQTALLGLRRQKTRSARTPDEGVVVRTLAFGRTCPAERGSKIGRLDILVLGQGVRVVPPDECPVIRFSSIRLPPP